MAKIIANVLVFFVLFAVYFKLFAIAAGFAAIVCAIWTMKAFSGSRS